MADDVDVGNKADAQFSERLIIAQRSIPRARMIDYGLPARDADFLQSLSVDSEKEWWDAAEDLGERHLFDADRQAASGNHAMAVLEREYASAAFNIGQLAINSDNETKRRLYGRATACLEENAGRPGCDYRRINVPLGTEGSLFGWHFRVPDAFGHVIMFGGLNGWGASFIRLARALGRQRIATVLAEAPGQGETRLISGLHLSRETIGHASRLIEFIADDGKPVGLVGFSFGGLIAAHVAAAVPTIAALCTNGSPVAIEALNHPVERELFGAAFGGEGDALLERVKDFNFDSDTEIIRCPVLSLEGGADPLVAAGTWRGFVGDGHPAADPRFWEDGLHTLYNHSAERDALIASWMSDCFRRKMEY
ncbi:pimeloyl-ACP methyl ester carboxylesterase [Novosphingobium chloroacetimidivorans]|uniref:Pimeloyl-ACP methyl ester carboxylesterase n=1 Tax=Novosphingobium chloroacetimidivorans TaxID=1428314 RepID=A0A7W7KCJ0_9SPHN|nr:alpha/beta fold hydrolase [Novosphingobium chloroacetimidivorans]MBB4860297.1 pimeloyl-ACP methyl ester carboxylesterase [Novosphingobium chloroacetimidivorans]